jgi:RimJ/RimL family protein N-acetyltransferase
MMADDGFTELGAERIFLRRFRPADLDDFVAYRSLPDVARYQSWEAPYPRDEGERFIQDMQTAQPDTPGDWFQFAVGLRPAGRLIGDVAAMPDPDDPRQVEIGFTIAPAYQGRGYATEAARRLLDYLFGQRAKHRVTANCDARNDASARVLQRIGMRREGHLLESSWVKDEWTDDLLFAVLRREWTESSRG